jgi:hypothetical protein
MNTKEKRNFSLRVLSHERLAAAASDGSQDGGGLVDLAAVKHSTSGQHHGHLYTEQLQHTLHPANTMANYKQNHLHTYSI